jgi:hypothetical protein
LAFLCLIWALIMLSFLLMWSNWCKYTKSTITINKILIY